MNALARENVAGIRMALPEITIIMVIIDCQLFSHLSSRSLWDLERASAKREVYGHPFTDFGRDFSN